MRSLGVSSNPDGCAEAGTVSHHKRPRLVLRCLLRAPPPAQAQGEGGQAGQRQGTARDPLLDALFPA